MGPVLVLAPIGRDAAEIGRVLGGMGVPSRAPAGLAALCGELRPDGGAAVSAVVIAEEALAAGTEALAACLARQPPWSDLPVVVLTAGGRRRGTGGRWALFEGLGNVALLDRPFHAEELRSAARAALRARARQHGARRHLEALRVAAETLEARVAERTAELRANEDALRQAQKMEAVGQLTGGVAHDFNNLLTVVMGGLAMLRRRLAHDPALLRYVEAASSAAGRGAKLTHQLLAFARRQPLQAEDLDLNEVVLGVADLLRRTVGGASALEFALCADGPLPVRADRNQLEMALLNLVVNARDASPDGGRITVETSRAAAAPASAPGDGEGPRVRLVVRDQGAGMAPEVVGRAFEPFFTTKAAGAGTGLGLSMVYGFVRQSGGDVDIESAPGRGTAVRILLPEGDRLRPAPGAPDEPPDAIRPSQGERILVVEDDPDVRAVAVAALEQLGYPVREAGDGEAALRLLDADPGIDLLFTDVVMPGPVDGLALARAARGSRPGLRVIVTSGRLPAGADLDAAHGPRGAFLAKPYRPVDLALAVQSILSADEQRLAEIAP